MRIKETACARCDGPSYSSGFYRPGAGTIAGTLNRGSPGNSFLELHIIALSWWTQRFQPLKNTLRIMNAGFQFLMRFH